jgi:hypothetical protein
VNIPALLILKSLENDDKEICGFFYPEMSDVTSVKGRLVGDLKKLYENLRRKYGSYEIYNLLEKCLIEVPLTQGDKNWIKELDLEKLMIRDIKCLAMQLSRYKPADWNKFLDVVVK